MTAASPSLRIAIADPPYPPARDGKRRASRWYGNAPLSATDRPADVHVDAREWDDPRRHRELVEELTAEYDGWAIATTPAASIYLVAQPDYDDENIDSAWTTEDAALARAAELGRAFVSEYRADAAKGWVRNGWAPANDPPVWSDWGGSGV